MKEEKAMRGQCNVDQARITFQKNSFADSAFSAVSSSDMSNVIFNTSIEAEGKASSPNVTE